VVRKIAPYIAGFLLPQEDNKEYRIVKFGVAHLELRRPFGCAQGRLGDDG
jgi:hypothetical protein